MIVIALTIALVALLLSLVALRRADKALEKERPEGGSR